MNTIKGFAVLICCTVDFLCFYALMSAAIAGMR